MFRLDSIDKVLTVSDSNTHLDIPEEDDRNISDLQTDQIEFSDVIVVNKCDLVPAEEIARIKAVIRRLNHSAKILTSIKSKVDVSEIINTNLFTFEKAALGAGWLKSLQEEVTPETEEYGIGTFVYKARRPFHPSRLWETIKKVFVVIQEEYIDDGENEEMDEDKVDGSGAGSVVSGDSDDGASQSENEEGCDTDMNMDMEESQPQLNPQARLASKQADPTFGPLLRSKGFFWLASRPKMVRGTPTQSHVVASHLTEE